MSQKAECPKPARAGRFVVAFLQAEQARPTAEGTGSER
jgi:hypothetical protein